MEYFFGEKGKAIIQVALSVGVGLVVFATFARAANKINPHWKRDLNHAQKIGF